MYGTESAGNRLLFPRSNMGQLEKALSVTYARSESPLLLVLPHEEQPHENPFSFSYWTAQQGVSKGAALAEEGADGREMPKTGLSCERMGRIGTEPTCTSERTGTESRTNDMC